MHEPVPLWHQQVANSVSKYDTKLIKARSYMFHLTNKLFQVPGTSHANFANGAFQLFRGSQATR